MDSQGAVFDIDPVFLIAGAADNLAILVVDHQHVPAQLVGRKAVAAIRSKLVRLDGAILEVKATSQSLHGSKIIPIRPRVSTDLLKCLRRLSYRRGQEYQSAWRCAERTEL